MSLKNYFVSKLLTTKQVDYILIRKNGIINGIPVSLPPFKLDVDFHQIGFSPDFITLIAKSKFTEGELKVLLFICLKINQDEGSVNLIVSDISKFYGYSNQKVRDAINKFRSIGLLMKKGGRGNSHSYHVNPFYIFRGNRISYFEKLGFKGLNCLKVLLKSI